MMTLQQLPHEIIVEILSRLPYEYVIQCKEVCKTWENILDHIKRDHKVNLLIAGKHNFNGTGRRHDDVMKLYYGEYDEKSNKTLGEQLCYNALTPLGYPFDLKHSVPYNNDGSLCSMVGSHRGLVCFHKDYFYGPIFICNPFTKETVRLPTLRDFAKEENNGFLVIGFGYIYSTNEYKIVKIEYEYSRRRICPGQVHVYTLGDKRRWRNKGKTDHFLSESNGVFSDGALHWVDDMGSEIVAFDLADEEFRIVPPPPCFPLEESRYCPLLLFGGYLSVVVRRFNTGTIIYSFKETKNQGGRKHWSKVFTIRSKDPSRPYYHPFALIQEDKILMSMSKEEWCRETTLCLYDHKAATLEEFVDDDAKKFQEFQAVPYIKSDVSLRELEPDLHVVNWDQL